MGIDEAIKKLEVSNQGINVILENLFYAYLKTWIKSNTEILDILNKEKK